MTLPSEFTARTKALLGEADYHDLETALGTPPPVSIRLNPAKLTGRPVASDPVAWCRNGYYLPGRCAFTFDPLLHAGIYYVQEAASMFLEHVIRNCITTPVKCLDLCAAPGGKTTLLAASLPAGSLLVGNEAIRSRSLVLAENTAKWGNPDTWITNDDPETLGRLTRFFDVIVADVPCSGEGMFRKDPESTAEWSAAHVALCAARQRRIIHDVWNALAPGGLLVYSTCTYNTEENEENVRWISEELGAEAVAVPVPAGWNIAGPLKYNAPVFRFLPHRTRGEGFFLAVLRKADDSAANPLLSAPRKKEKGKSAPPPPATVCERLQNPGDFVCEADRSGERFRAVSRQHYPDYRLLTEQLHPVRAGILLGEAKGKDWQPSQELALSTALRPDAFPTVEIDWDTAIRYLRKEAVALPGNPEKGYVLLTYRQAPLGFVKHLGNRSNNLYPAEWRIRTTYRPDDLRLPDIGPADGNQA